MKIFFNILFLILITVVTANAQIPNEGFESWTGNNPTGWVTGNIENYVFVTPTDSPMSGQFAASIETKAINGILIPGILNSGEGFPVYQRHGQFSLYYKFYKTSSNAHLSVSIGFKKGENGIGAKTIAIFEPADNFTPLMLDVHYVNDQIPDAAVIHIQVSDQFMSPAASGSYAVVDNMSFQILADAEEENYSPDQLILEQNFPNPFNPETTIKYTVPEKSDISLKVYNVLGNEVAELVNETQEQGSYSINFNASELSSGVYFYTLKAGNTADTKKLILLR